VFSRPSVRRTARPLFAVACVLLGAALIVKAWREHSDKRAATDAPFRVATYNICHDNRDLALAVEAIRQSGADVVALQETSARSEAYVRDHLGQEYPHMVFHGGGGKYLAEQFGILSKHPVVRTTFLEPEHGLFGAQIADVRIDGRCVAIVNVHLNPLRLRSVRGPMGLMEAVRTAEAAHAAEIRRIHAALDPGMPTVILGDFNSMSPFAAPRFLREHGFTDSFAVVVEDPDAHATWNWPTRFAHLRARIDYIFHSSAFETRESRVIANDSSDHSLLVSELAWRRNDR
jgi:endonuclease/exonuclease/phosphatase (EEP) superfamily protein YafD